MATIYLSTETLSYNIHNWSRAVSVASIQTVDPQQGSVLPMDEMAWTCILPYVGERAINMRKVCAFFLQPCFDESYKASPVTPEGTGYRNCVLEMIFRAKCQFTNRALYFRSLPTPADLGIAQKQIRREHWDRFINQMPLCQSIGPIYSSEVKALAELEKAPEILARIVSLYLETTESLLQSLTSVRHLSDLVLTIYKLPDEILQIPQRSFLSLTSFVCRMSGLYLNLDILSHFLKTMPYLSKFHLEFRPQQPDCFTGHLNLEPASLPSLRDLKLCVLSFDSASILTFIEAVSNLYRLEIVRSQAFGRVCDSLLPDSLPALREVRIDTTPLIWKQLLGLFKAAPQLTTFSINKMLGNTSAHKIFESLFLRVFICDGSSFDERPESSYIRGLLPLMHRMPLIEDVRLSSLNFFLDEESIFKEPPGFFKNVTRLDLVNLKMSNIMLMYILSRVHKLKSLRITHIHPRDIAWHSLDEGFSDLTDIEITDVKITPISLSYLLSKTPNLESLSINDFMMYSSGPEMFDISFSLPKLTDCKLGRYGCLNEDNWVRLLKAAPNIIRLEINSKQVLSVIDRLSQEEGFLLSELKTIFYPYDKHWLVDKTQVEEKISKIAPNFQGIHRITGT